VTISLDSKNSENIGQIRNLKNSGEIGNIERKGIFATLIICAC
jgi:hypothetical protein